MRPEISDALLQADSRQADSRAVAPRLTVTGLACVRGGRRVFAELSFAIAGGEALAVTGPNGAGKTSLLRMIAGLLHPEAGRIVLEGGAEDAALAEQAHYLGHRDALKPSLSVLENLSFWRDFLGAPGDRGDLRAVLAAVGLAHAAELPAAYLSAGQRRRLSFARLIAVRRPLWLLDEPLTALDAAGQALVVDLMTAHLAAGGLLLAATHGPLGVEARELSMGAPSPSANSS